MLELSVQLTPASLHLMKGALRRGTPETKASHRTEALARGLGFPTHASLLAAIGSDLAPRRVNAEAYSTYLSERGLPHAQRAVFQAVAFAAVSMVLDRDHKLQSGGYGAGRFRRKDDGAWESAYEHYDRFQARRAELLDDWHIEQFLCAVALLAEVPMTRTVRPDTDSYRLKHIAEKYPVQLDDGEILGPAYVSNGALIVAAMHLGFRYRAGQDDLGYDWPNVTFNMSQKALLELDCLHRPNGARAQDRLRRSQAFRRFWTSGL